MQKIGQNVRMFRFIHSFLAPHYRTGLLTLGLLNILLLTACTPAQESRKPWREELAVIVLPAENNMDSDFERHLSTLFAQQLHVPIKFIPYPTNRIMQALVDNEAHFAAAGIRSNESKGIQFGPVYQTVREKAICNSMPTRRMEELIRKNITVVAKSSQETALHEARKKFPALNWHTSHNRSVEQLLVEVAEGRLECTIANEEQLALARNYYPDLDSSLDIAAPSRLAWAFAPDTDTELLTEAQKFFTLIKLNGTLHRLLDRYYGHSKRLESGDAVAFITKTRTILPHIRHLFEEAATLTGIEWQLLAALAYHESHWDPLATSPTKVRGMMMLTESTADRMGVTNRLDARQSIIGGARYLLLLKQQLPLRIDDPDRTWFALAAYNQGLGHLEDARVLAKKQGYNPDKWTDVKKVMPLLAQQPYFEQARHGYARGGEAVILVETVRMHNDMLHSLPVGTVPLLIPPLPDKATKLRTPSGPIHNLPASGKHPGIRPPQGNGGLPMR